MTFLRSLLLRFTRWGKTVFSCAVLLLLTGGAFSVSGTASRSAGAQADTTDHPQAQRYLIKGITETQLGDYEEAILYFETALDRAPAAPTLLGALADAHEAQGDIATALFYARQARTHGPDRPHHYRRLAELQQKTGERQAALQAYRDLLDRFPNHKPAYRALASLQTEMGRTEAVLDTYRTLLDRVDRPAVETYRKMLALQRRVGKTQGIEKSLQALVDRRPNISTYRRQLGEHYAETNRPQAALDILAPLAQQHPQDASLQHLVEDLSRQTGRSLVARPTDDSSAAGDLTTLSAEQLVQKARSTLDVDGSSSASPDSTRLRRAKGLLQSVLDRTPTHLAALTVLARIHREEGNYQDAGQVLERALEDHPRDPNRWAEAADAYLQSHRYKKAASLSEEGLLLFPGNYTLTRTTAEALVHSGGPQRALDRFQQALDLQKDEAPDPSEAATLQAGLGLAYTYLDRPKEADEAFDAARTAAPNHPAVLRRHAYSLALRNVQLDRALKLARWAANQSPDHPLSLGTLGWVYFQRGNLEAARRHLQQALQQGPPVARLLEQYGDVQHALGNDATARKYWQQALDRAPNRTSLEKKLDETPTS